MEENVVWKYAGDVQGVPYRRICYAQGYLYLIPSAENKVLKVCLQNDEVVESKEFVLWESEKGKAKSGEYFLHGEELWITASG